MRSAREVKPFGFFRETIERLIRGLCGAYAGLTRGLRKTLKASEENPWIHSNSTAALTALTI